MTMQSQADQPALERPASRLRLRAPSWLREPLLHFAILGAIIFAADHVLVSRANDPKLIVVGRSVISEARTAFRQTRGRDPNPQELQALTGRWVDNEILYREGLALQVDQGDAMIRDRVIFKSLMVVDSGLKLPPVDEKVLRDWFESHRSRYDEPARFDFQEAVLDGDATESAARDFARALNSGTPGDAKAGLRVFKSRPLANLEQSYGADFARLLAESTPGEWKAIASTDGVRVVRLDAKSAPRAASFEALRHVVLPDWTDATMAQMRTDAVRLRGKKYHIKLDEAAP